VPWRFSDAGRISAGRASSSPASENLHKSRLMHCSKRRAQPRGPPAGACRLLHDGKVEGPGYGAAPSRCPNAKENGQISPSNAFWRPGNARSLPHLGRDLQAVEKVAIIRASSGFIRGMPV
jgi:hypothetical protein